MSTFRAVVIMIFIGLVCLIIAACQLVAVTVSTSQIADNTGRDGGSDYKGGKANETKENQSDETKLDLSR